MIPAGPKPDFFLQGYLCTTYQELESLSGTEIIDLKGNYLGNQVEIKGYQFWFAF